MTCQQLDCMQRHAEGHGHLWQQQAIVLNEQLHPKSSDKQAELSITSEQTTMSAAAATVTALNSPPDDAAGLAMDVKDTSGLRALPDNDTKESPSARTSTGRLNDWVVIPVFADIVKLALAERENCLQR